MIRVLEWVAIKDGFLRPVDGYGQVLHFDPMSHVYTINARGFHWRYYEHQLEVIDPEKELGEEYFA